MLNRKTIFLVPTLIISLGCITSISAINRYFIGDTLYVWADGGLVIRDAPGIKSNRIGEIAYGEQLVVQEGKYYRYEEEELTIIKKSQDDKGHVFLPVKIQGKWVKIKYKNIEGFVFDGYLSVMPAPGLINNEYPELYEYIQKHFVLLSESKRSEDEYIFTNHEYTGGISMYGFASKSGYSRLVLPQFSLEEVLLLLKNSNAINNVSICLTEELTNKEERFRILNFDHITGGEGSTRITVTAGLVIIEFEAWC